MDDPKIEDRSGQMEDDLHQLEDNIADAEKKFEARKGDSEIADDVAGDWEGEQDHHGGDDPAGAAGETGAEADADEPDATGAEADADEPVDEELENPT